MVLSDAPKKIETPPSWFPSGCVPATVVPIRFPSTRLSWVPELTRSIPSAPLPEMTLPAPAVVPPIVLPLPALMPTPGTM